MVTINSLQLKKKVIALEAATPAGIVGGLGDRISIFLTDSSTFLKQSFNLGGDGTASIINNPSLMQKLNTTIFTSVSPVSVSIPPGLDCSFVELATLLKEAERVTSNLMTTVLLPFNRWLGVQISNPSRLSSQATNVKIDGFKQHPISELREKFSKAFGGNPNITTVPYSTVFKRNADFRISVELINTLTENSVRRNAREVRETIDEITNRLEILVRRIGEDPDTFKLSGITATVLSDLCFDVAKECEFYSFYHHTLESTTQALKSSAESLSKALKI
jgi:hypothetical protein